MTRPSDCPVYAGYCSVHGFTHGAEAEELRHGLEGILARNGQKIPRRDLLALLDQVDARDSLAFLDRKMTRVRRASKKRAARPIGDGSR